MAGRFRYSHENEWVVVETVFEARISWTRE